MAHKKAAGSAKNLRDSQPKYRGIKVFGGQSVVAGNIIVRQKGNKYQSGKNTYITKDFTIHAEIDGVVEFSRSNKIRFDNRRYLRTVVNVLPNVTEETKETPAKKATAKKATAKKATAKKATAKKATAKKAPAKKATAKKATAKKATAKKAPAKKATAKKAPAKKAPAKKATAKKSAK